MHVCIVQGAWVGDDEDSVPSVVSSFLQGEAISLSPLVNHSKLLMSFKTSMMFVDCDSIVEVGTSCLVWCEWICVRYVVAGMEYKHDSRSKRSWYFCRGGGYQHHGSTGCHEIVHRQYRCEHTADYGLPGTCIVHVCICVDVGYISVVFGRAITRNYWDEHSDSSKFVLSLDR